MQIEPFALERWFDRYEHDADIMLAESGIRSLDSADFDTDPGELGYVIPTDGDPEFRATIAERYDRTAEEVVFTCGTQEANLLAFLSLVGEDEDDHAVVVTPTYQSLRSVPAAFGEVSTVWLDPPDWRLDAEDLKAAIRPETEVVVVNNPNNPTGRYHAAETIEACYEIAADNDAYLLCDEVYRLLAADHLPPVASMGDRGISTTSLTKAYGLAGLRFGWLCGSSEVADSARKWKDYTTISPSIFGQHVARQVLDPAFDADPAGDAGFGVDYDGSVDPDGVSKREAAILAENRELAARNRERVSDFIAEYSERGLSWHEPVGVNGFLTVPDGFESGRAFCRQVVEEESIVLAPGECFGVESNDIGGDGRSETGGVGQASAADGTRGTEGTDDGSEPDLGGYFRLGFGLPTSELEEGLSRLGEFLDRNR
ncbi:aminotransferase [Halobacteriales archaeon QS_8_65_32]|nr:MAG: aminotransferase [Halobacteriales archaeon QS_8_65_32]